MLCVDFRCRAGQPSLAYPGVPGDHNALMVATSKSSADEAEFFATTCQRLVVHHVENASDVTIRSSSLPQLSQ